MCYFLCHLHDIEKNTPSPRIMRIPLVRNSTCGRFEKKILKYSLGANLFHNEKHCLLFSANIVKIQVVQNLVNATCPKIAFSEGPLYVHRKKNTFMISWLGVKHCFLFR